MGRKTMKNAESREKKSSPNINNGVAFVARCFFSRFPGSSPVTHCRDAGQEIRFRSIR